MILTTSVSAKSPTPILDLESPLPEIRQWDRLSWRQALLIVVLPLITVFLIAFALSMLSDTNPAVAKMFKYIEMEFDPFFKGSGAQSPLLVFLFYFLTFLLILSIHELGHVAAGLAVGFHFKTMRIGPLTVAKSKQGLKFTLRRISNVDGIAAMGIPPLRKLRHKLIIYIAAGPMANFLSGLCIFLFLTSPAPGSLQHAIPQYLEFFAGFSILIAVFNLIPYQRRNGMFTDGARLLSLAVSKVKTRRWLCILALNRGMESGVRLRDLKPTWIAHSCELPDGSLDTLQACWIAYLVCNDREEPDLAARHLEKCLECFGIASAQFKKTLLMQAAIFQAWFRDDEQKAKIWSQRSEGGPPAPLLSQLHLAICLHWAGRRYDELAAAWETGRMHIENLQASPAKNRMKDVWLKWKNEIDKKRAVREALPKP